MKADGKNILISFLNLYFASWTVVDASNLRAFSRLSLNHKWVIFFFFCSSSFEHHSVLPILGSFKRVLQYAPNWGGSRPRRIQRHSAPYCTLKYIWRFKAELEGAENEPWISSSDFLMVQHFPEENPPLKPFFRL